MPVVSYHRASRNWLAKQENWERYYSTLERALEAEPTATIDPQSFINWTVDLANVLKGRLPLGPVTDPPLHGAPAERPTYLWLALIGVSETWVEDGFDLNDDRLDDMVAGDLTHSYAYERLARVLGSPPEKAVRVAQGYEKETT